MFINQKTDMRKKYLKGFAYGTAVSLLLLVFAAILMTKKDISINTVKILSTIIFGISGFVTAYITAKAIGSRGLKNGFISGLIVFIIVTLIGFCLGGTFNIYMLLKFFVISLASIIGGVMGVNAKAKRRMK